MIEVFIKSSPTGTAIDLGARSSRGGNKDYLSARLSQFIERLDKGWAEPLRVIGYEFMSLERQWLDSEGNGTWRPLNKLYAQRKLQYLGAKPLLQSSGAMYKALTRTSPRTVTIRNNFLRVNTVGARYWAVHQHGSAKRRIPKRQVITPDLRKYIKRWSTLLMDWYTGKPSRPHGINRGRAR